MSDRMDSSLSIEQIDKLQQDAILLASNGDTTELDKQFPGLTHETLVDALQAIKGRNGALCRLLYSQISGTALNTLAGTTNFNVWLPLLVNTLLVWLQYMTLQEPLEEHELKPLLEESARAAFCKWESIYETGDSWEALMDCDRENWRQIIREAISFSKSKE